MNFVKECALVRCISVVLVFSLFLCGCSNVVVSSPEKLVEFNSAGPIQPEIDLDKLVAAKTTGTYKVVVGDILELRMSSVLYVVTAEIPDSLETSIPTFCRVYDDSTISVPIIGKIQAAGRTLAEIETSIVNTYYPEYSPTRPAVIVRVSEYKTIKVSINGAVEEPGVYELSSSENSLVSLIMKAGGIVDDGAAFIHIKRSLNSTFNGDSVQLLDAQGVSLSLRQDRLTNKNTLLIRKEGQLLYSEEIDLTSDSQRKAFVSKISSENPDLPIDYVTFKLCELSELIKPGSCSSGLVPNENTTLTLPVKGLNIPFADVKLQDGTSVEVEPLNPEVFTVVGLVNRSGVFPYPPNVKYNLMQALAFASGVNELADPRFVKVYRQKADGELIDAIFALNGTSPVGAPSVMIRPGDVVSVEQTARTHRNIILSEIIGINIGASYNYFDGRDFRRRD